MQDTARIPFLKPKCVRKTGCAVCAIYASCAGTAAHRHNNRIMICLFVCFVALRPKSTAKVIAGRSVHLTTLFPGQA